MGRLKGRGVHGRDHVQAYKLQASFLTTCKPATLQEVSASPFSFLTTCKTMCKLHTTPW